MLLHNPAGKTNVKRYLVEFCYPQYRLQIRSESKARKREETSRIMGAKAFQKYMDNNVDSMVAHASKGEVKEITGWHAEDDDFEASFMVNFKKDYPGREYRFGLQWMKDNASTLLEEYAQTIPELAADLEIPMSIHDQIQEVVEEEKAKHEVAMKKLQSALESQKKKTREANQKIKALNAKGARPSTKQLEGKDKSIKDLKEKLKHEKDLGKTKQKEIAAQAKQIKESTKQLANLKAQLTLEKATSKKKDEELATIKQELATLKHELQNAQVPPRQPRLSVLQRSPQFVERRVSDFATSSPSPMQGGDQAQLFQRFLAFEEFNRRNSQGTSRRSSGSSRYMPYGAFN
jgi:myosin heavy subunit